VGERDGSTTTTTTATTISDHQISTARKRPMYSSVVFVGVFAVRRTTKMTNQIP
jgi:hypothetical protein